MPLLTLQDIGKIYVSEGAIAVGIRGVSLSFDRGEFVAITGKSGSGKSTLLNVISGMDSYEEGEMLINGQPTSHYLQPEWELYREKYISFIFQDYNIIDSFTVLQNVELALMHIENPKERRKRALALLDRVGLSSHLHQKGSRLSGGQKQRTVIARALAKDSPIILADEPTGNLDSATSAEIMALLHEVSKDKLLIVVTHSFDQVADYATRHIRVFDGAIESDHPLQPRRAASVCTAAPVATGKKSKQIKDGFSLGRSIFTAKPKLSVFLCVLMIIGTLGIFTVTAACGDFLHFKNPYTMFNHINGRVVLTTQNGEVLTKSQIQALAEEFGAIDYLRYDLLLDNKWNRYAEIASSDIGNRYDSMHFRFTYGENFGSDIVGRYPEAVDEVFLYVPISYQPNFGKDTLLIDLIQFSGATYRITGVGYYYDNNLPPKCLFTRTGFETATALYYLYENASNNISLTILDTYGKPKSQVAYYNLLMSFQLESDKIYVDRSTYKEQLISSKNYSASLTFSSTYYNYNYYSGDSVVPLTFARTFYDDEFAATMPELSFIDNYDAYTIIFSDEIIYDIANTVLDKSYRQASLFFENDAQASKAAELLRDAGYIAVPSFTTYEPDALTAIMDLLESLMLLAVWGFSIVFLAFFLNLCSSRTIGAFKEDMTIMRSMGISVSVIRIAIYVRMLAALIPAFILLGITAILIFTSPQTNAFFTYLYGWQYALIVLGMLLLTLRITGKQIRNLFSSSVKKALKGGASE